MGGIYKSSARYVSGPRGGVEVKHILLFEIEQRA